MANRVFSAPVDGRWLTAALFLAFAAALKLTALTTGRPVFELPPFSWFGPMAPYFADLRGVVSWSDQYAANPAASGSHVLLDPWNRPMNYPHPWLYLHDLGVNGANVMTAGYVLDLLFLAGALYVLGPLDLFGGVVAGSFLTSYVVMFGMERANVDLLMFALLALALGARGLPPVAATFISTAAILKIHPLFALGAMLRPPWRISLLSIVAALTLFAGVVGLYLHEFLAGLGTAPNLRTGDHSFGVTALGLQLFANARRPDFYSIILAVGVTAFVFVVGMAAYVRPLIGLRPDDERALFAFRIGAGIYLGSYLLGSNHDYRAACLVFCLPLLLRLFRRGAGSRWPFWTLLLVLVSANWLAFANDGPALVAVVKQAVSWSLLFCLAALYAATLPEILHGPRRLNRQKQCDQPLPQAVSSSP